MRNLLSNIRSAVLATVALAAICCGMYPLLVYGLAQLVYPRQAGGSLIVDRHGVVRGSEQIGQGFAGARYFHARPSAAGAGYDAVNSGGSNLGPTSRALRDAVKDRIDTYRKTNGLRETETVPADAVTTSASGLDPHISPASARLQAPRVATARGLPASDVAAFVERSIESPQCALFGEPRVNVLRMNLALDDSTGSR